MAERPPPMSFLTWIGWVEPGSERVQRSAWTQVTAYPGGRALAFIVAASMSSRVIWLRYHSARRGSTTTLPNRPADHCPPTPGPDGRLPAELGVETSVPVLYIRNTPSAPARTI